MRAGKDDIDTSDANRRAVICLRKLVPRTWISFALKAVRLNENIVAAGIRALKVPERTMVAQRSSGQGKECLELRAGQRVGAVRIG